VPDVPLNRIVRRPFAAAVLVAVIFGLTAWTDVARLLAQSPRPATNVRFTRIDPAEMQEWLTYLASDELQGRRAFSEGYGLAAQYVAERLREWGLTPLGANGTYLQPVLVGGYRATRNSVVTLEVNGKTRTFKHGEHVTFPANAGGPQTLTFETAEFIGPRAEDAARADLAGRLLVIVPDLTPPGAPGASPAGGTPSATAPGTTPAIPPATTSAARVPPPVPPTPGAVIRYAAPPTAPTAAEEALTRAQAALTQAAAAVADAQRGLRGARGGRGAAPAGRGAQPAPTPEFTSVQRLDTPVMPQLTADDTFFEALFEGSGTSFADIKARASKGEPQTPVSLRAKVTVAIDHRYELVSRQITHNVIGLIEGTDRRLKDTYVVFGAHLDHEGYVQSGATRERGTDGCRRRSPAAQATVTAAGKTVQRPTPARGAGPAAAGRAGAPSNAAIPVDQRDVISNGADDDASGSTVLLALAKAFATGPKPKRSVVIVWHTAEENGLQGSRFNADYPAVPLDRVQTVFNLDMVGRDDCDNLEGDFSNTVFVVGADRISTDLHNVIVETNRTLPSPLALDYELNDPQDPEGVYTRSDHYSYASKGIPVAFFTTGLHPDYHRVTDAAGRIRFDKMARIAQLVYQSGFAVAHSDATLVRDHKGPRTGFQSPAEILPR
jgi:hypothetical protein